MAEINSVNYRGFRAINYKHGLDYQHVFGTGKQPLGDTTGVYSAEGSFEMLLTDYILLIQNLGEGYMENHFSMIVKFSTRRGDPPIVDELKGVRIKNEDRGFSQSNEGLVIKIDLGIQLIVSNGNKALSSMIGV